MGQWSQAVGLSPLNPGSTVFFQMSFCFTCASRPQVASDILTPTGMWWPDPLWPLTVITCFYPLTPSLPFLWDHCYLLKLPVSVEVRTSLRPHSQGSDIEHICCHPGLEFLVSILVSLFKTKCLAFAGKCFYYSAFYRFPLLLHWSHWVWPMWYQTLCNLGFSWRSSCIMHGLWVSENVQILYIYVSI